MSPPLIAVALLGARLAFAAEPENDRSMLVNWLRQTREAGSQPAAAKAAAPPEAIGAAPTPAPVPEPEGPPTLTKAQLKAQAKAEKAAAKAAAKAAKAAPAPDTAALAAAAAIVQPDEQSTAPAPSAKEQQAQAIRAEDKQDRSILSNWLHKRQDAAAAKKAGKPVEADPASAPKMQDLEKLKTAKRNAAVEPTMEGLRPRARDLPNLAEIRRSVFGQGYEDNLRPHSLEDPGLAVVKKYVKSGQYKGASEQLEELTRDQPSDPSIEKLGERLDVVAYYYPDLAPSNERWRLALSSSVTAFIEGRDRASVLFGSYALALAPADPWIDHYVQKVEKTTGISATRLPPGNQRGFIDELLFRVQQAHGRGDNAHAETLLRDVLDIEPNSPTALERLGTSEFQNRRYAEAIQAWERAQTFETRPGELAALREYVPMAREQAAKAGQKVAPPSAQATFAPAPTAPKGPPIDPKESQRFYEKGAEFYAKGDMVRASAMYMRALQADPKNAQAKAALERVQTKGR